MKIDPEKAFECLKKGNVLYFENKNFEGRGKNIPHFYVLLNTPINGPLILVMVHGSSQIDRIKKIESSEPIGTLVYVETSEYIEFTKTTVFDCNVITALTKEEFIEKYGKDQIEIKNDIDSSIVSKLQKGVLESRKVELRYKKIIKDEIK